MRWPRLRRRGEPRGALPRQGRRVRATTPKRSRRLGWWLLGFGLVGLMGGLSQSPRLLRRMDTFRVRQVEVRGTRYLNPDEVLAASGLGERSSVFDSPDAWLASLGRHPMIESARIDGAGDEGPERGRALRLARVQLDHRSLDLCAARRGRSLRDPRSGLARGGIVPDAHIDLQALLERGAFQGPNIHHEHFRRLPPGQPAGAARHGDDDHQAPHRQRYTHKSYDTQTSFLIR